jgi:general stress protein 26
MENEFLHILERFDTAMLATRQPDGTLHARPMAVARAQNNGDLWFVSDIGSGKVEEVLRDSGVVATFQSPGRFLSISGTAEVVGDEALIEAIWREDWKTWFPLGRDDPGLVLIHVRAREAEYWDETRTRGVRYAFEKARAALRGRPFERADAEHHGKLEL